MIELYRRHRLAFAATVFSLLGALVAGLDGVGVLTPRNEWIYDLLLQHSPPVERAADVVIFEYESVPTPAEVSKSVSVLLSLGARRVGVLLLHREPVEAYRAALKADSDKVEFGMLGETAENAEPATLGACRDGAIRYQGFIEGAENPSFEYRLAVTDTPAQSQRIDFRPGQDFFLRTPLSSLVAGTVTSTVVDGHLTLIAPSSRAFPLLTPTPITPMATHMSAGEYFAYSIETAAGTSTLQELPFVWRVIFGAGLLAISLVLMARVSGAVIALICLTELLLMIVLARLVLAEAGLLLPLFNFTLLVGLLVLAMVVLRRWRQNHDFRDVLLNLSATAVQHSAVMRYLDAPSPWPALIRQVDALFPVQRQVLLERDPDSGVMRIAATLRAQLGELPAALADPEATAYLQAEVAEHAVPVQTGLFATGEAEWMIALRQRGALRAFLLVVPACGAEQVVAELALARNHCARLLESHAEHQNRRHGERRRRGSPRLFRDNPLLLPLSNAAQSLDATADLRSAILAGSGVNLLAFDPLGDLVESTPLAEALIRRLGVTPQDFTLERLLTEFAGLDAEQRRVLRRELQISGKIGSSSHDLPLPADHGGGMLRLRPYPFLLQGEEHIAGRQPLLACLCEFIAPAPNA